MTKISICNTGNPIIAPGCDGGVTCLLRWCKAVLPRAGSIVWRQFIAQIARRAALCFGLLLP